METTEGVVSAPLALPEERVVLGAVRRSGRALRGRVVRVEASSPERVPPVCAHVEACGGCPLMVASRALERDFKLGRLRQALARALVAGPEGAAAREAPIDGSMPAAALPVGWHEGPATEAYRRRARLAFDARGAGAEGGAPRLGYRRRRGNTLVDVERCPVLAPPLDDAWQAIRALLRGVLAGHGEIGLALVDRERVSVHIRAAEPQPPAAYAACEALLEQASVAGVSLSVLDAPPATWGDGVERVPSDRLEAPWLEGTAGGFSQANDAVNAALVRHVVELAEPAGARVLELYCGHGNLTVPLAVRARHVVAVEQSAEACRACERNLRARGLTASVRCADAASGAWGDARFDVVVLDPPRVGAADALPRIVEARPERVVYVSCDPRSLGRDLTWLGEQGYAVDRADAFDMFPHTAHVESVVRLRRLG
ncbi:MAG: class I SAM-dependent RNA methyltransferase [Myxococcales bacterium]|nr:class I SAM-dependent RNA methyltransferase [Myxococcales bacterium]